MNRLNRNIVFIVLLVAGAFFIGNLFLSSQFNRKKQSASWRTQNAPIATPTIIDDPLYPKFELLSSQGNSSCSQDYSSSISSMPDELKLQGSCCSPMVFHRYKEQVEGLKKYSSISQVPSDPYDIPASLAKELLAYDENITLNPDEQKEYDKAMQTSEEKGPCCCKCWRWYVYGGLGKFLIKNHKFTGEQIADIWNLSDGCGGDRHLPGAHTG